MPNSLMRQAQENIESIVYKSINLLEANIRGGNPLFDKMVMMMSTPYQMGNVDINHDQRKIVLDIGIDSPVGILAGPATQLSVIRKIKRELFNSYSAGNKKKTLPEKKELAKQCHQEALKMAPIMVYDLMDMNNPDKVPNDPHGVLAAQKEHIQKTHQSLISSGVILTHKRDGKESLMITQRDTNTNAYPEAYQQFIGRCAYSPGASSLTELNEEAIMFVERVSDGVLIPAIMTYGGEHGKMPLEEKRAQIQMFVEKAKEDPTLLEKAGIDGITKIDLNEEIFEIPLQDNEADQNRLYTVETRRCGEVIEAGYQSLACFIKHDNTLELNRSLILDEDKLLENGYRIKAIGGEPFGSEIKYKSVEEFAHEFDVSKKSDLERYDESAERINTLPSLSHYIYYKCLDLGLFNGFSKDVSLKAKALKV